MICNICLIIWNMYHCIGLFSKETNKRDNILQKRPMILKSLLIVATPYDHV